jgi:hypothetical protein
MKIAADSRATMKMFRVQIVDAAGARDAPYMPASSKKAE